jgi:hypothetical protein
MAAGKVTPGRNCVFWRFRVISATSSDSRAQSHTFRPAWAATIARTVPQAPAPITPILSYGFVSAVSFAMAAVSGLGCVAED